MNNGGAAFPALHTIDENWTPKPLTEYSGMSLRDYFAAKALPAIVAEFRAIRGHLDGTTDYDASFVCEVAYKLADAMLKERAK